MAATTDKLLQETAMALLPLWLIGSTLVIALVSVMIDGTFSRTASPRRDATPPRTNAAYSPGT